MGGGEVDEDQEAEEDSGEAKEARQVIQPRAPSKQEREEHERTHIPFRCWCEHCVRGSGMQYPHKSVVGGAVGSNDVVRVILDHCFFTGGRAGDGNAEAEAEADDATSSVTALVLKETLCGSV